MSESRASVTHFFVVVIVVIVWSVVLVFGQRGNPEVAQRDHPEIEYSSRDLHDPVAILNRQLLEGSMGLNFDSAFGYLPALLEQLRVPLESQVLVFSKTSLQSALIGPGNPRAIYFNDSLTIAWVRGGPILEIAAQDPQQGVIFYTLSQDRQNRPSPARENVCLSCHDTGASLQIPGVVIRSVFPGATGLQVAGLSGSAVDHRTAFDQRWGGWYVTGKRGPLRHLANAVVSRVREDGALLPVQDREREPLAERFSTTGYPTPYSDIVALAIFEHQVHMMNLITRTGWEARLALSRDPSGGNEVVWKSFRDWMLELVDYLLFVDEAPMTASLEGTSGFTEKFQAQGPFDRKHRSLREFDLNKRLMRYPCSYMIYSEAFDALPLQARDAIYRRLWEILSRQESDSKYGRLSTADRKAVVEILRETRKDLPDYFMAGKVP